MAQVASATTHRELTREEAHELFDEMARRYLNIGGDDFVRAWDQGKFDEDPDRPEVMRLAFLLPLVR